jgi:hypothetical protein
MDSFRAHQFTENGVATFNGSYKARTPSVASNVHLDWQLSGYYNHSDSTAPELQSTAAPILPNHADYEPWKPSGFESSRLCYEQFLPDVSEPSRPTQDPLQYKQENVSSAWNSSPPTASHHEEVLSPCTYSTPPPDSAWVSIADSSYGSLPNSSHGSGYSEEDSTLHASGYFACSNVGNFAGDIHAQSAIAAASTVEAASTSKVDRAEQRDRVRQDAHSKVEKRYRMNINSMYRLGQLRKSKLMAYDYSENSTAEKYTRKQPFVGETISQKRGRTQQARHFISCHRSSGTTRA